MHISRISALDVERLLNGSPSSAQKRSCRLVQREAFPEKRPIVRIFKDHVTMYDHFLPFEGWSPVSPPNFISYLTLQRDTDWLTQNKIKLISPDSWPDLTRLPELRWCVTTIWALKLHLKKWLGPGTCCPAIVHGCHSGKHYLHKWALTILLFMHKKHMDPYCK